MNSLYVCTRRGVNFEKLIKKRHSYYFFSLKVQSCKLYNNKDLIASPQINNTEVFGFKDVQVIVFIVFKLLSHKVLFINRKDSSKL